MTPLLALLMFASPAGLGPALDRSFPEPGLNYLLIDAHTREILAARWPDAEMPIPVGSLVKPFTALAFAGPYPEFVCKGAASRCWLAPGHGRLNFEDALADSCNGYFLNLARQVDHEALSMVASKYGVPAPVSATPETRIGLGAGWRIAPLALTRAYAELASSGAEPRVAEILAGLEQAARRGTASAVGQVAIGRGENGYRAMAKTGTAPCVAEHRDSGDGFTVVLYPADAPRVVLLVRVHGVPGAEAAKSAARILRVVQTGR